MSNPAFAHPDCSLCKGLIQTNPYSEASAFNSYFPLRRLYEDSSYGPLKECRFCSFIRAIVALIRSNVGEINPEGSEAINVSLQGTTQDIPRDDHGPSRWLDKLLAEEATADNNSPWLGTSTERAEEDWDDKNDDWEDEPDMRNLEPKLRSLGVDIYPGPRESRFYEYSVVLAGGRRQYREALDQLPWLALESGERILRGRTGSVSALKWTQSRLSECLKSHALCQSQSSLPQVPLLPTRVLDLSQATSVRLFETSGERAVYACLSHCWGGSLSLTTTTSNLPKHKQSIAWDSLSRTFQETIVVLRKLDIKYVWIDSLCIIQDSDEDWRNESAKMADIYSNAYITIAATQAANGSVGLFSSTELAMTWEGVPIVLLKRPTHFKRRQVLSETPLLTRGWVAQEMMLSPRVLHFCDGELVLECMEAWDCTCGNAPDRGGKKANKLSDVIWSPLAHVSNAVLDAEALEFERARQSLTRMAAGDSSKGVPTTSVTKSSRRAEFDRWQEFVIYYAKLNLSFEKDRLVACSGLARKFAEKYKATYAAGLWCEDYCSGLIWHYDGFPGTRIRESTAPSWSWASVVAKGYLAPGRGGGVPMYCSNITSRCEPVSENNPYGQVKSARLTMSGILLPMEFYRKSWDGSEVHPVEYHFKYANRFGFKVVPDIDVGEPGSPDENTTIFGLPLDKEEYDTKGLLVRRVSDNEFERVGYWRCKNRGGYYAKAPEEWSSEKLHPVLQGLKRELIILV